MPRILPPVSDAPPVWLDDHQSSAFLSTQRFHDAVHGLVFLSQLERDVVDSPELQRLFRVHQLGFVSSVFRTANHTRGAHSIGACSVAKHLIALINHNTRKVDKDRRERRGAKSSSGDDATVQVSFASSVLIALGALLHDLPHPPLSHDIEKRSHKLKDAQGHDVKVGSFLGPYPKHDDYESNPAFYRMILDSNVSVLARVLQAYSPKFWELMVKEVDVEKRSGVVLDTSDFVGFIRKRNNPWKAIGRECLPHLLFHLLAYEKPSQVGTLKVATSFDGKVDGWKLCDEPWVEQVWYQPFRHDIIGNTVSADLIDYLCRDFGGLGIDRKLDFNFLQTYVLASTSKKAPLVEGEESLPGFEARPAKEVFAPTVGVLRSAIDLNDYKRGTIRVDAVNDVFRLLDLRTEIHEKAVLHRVVQSLTAMMYRCLASLKPEQKPSLNEVYGWKPSPHAMSIAGADDSFLLSLLSKAAEGSDAHRLAQKIIERRAYKPLYVLPGDSIHQVLGGLRTSAESAGQLSAVVDSRVFAPFFNIVATTIERILDHSRRYEDLPEVLDSIVENEGRLSPKSPLCTRVAFHAPPFKQLYKDPGIIVRLHVPGDDTGSDLTMPLYEVTKWLEPAHAGDKKVAEQLKSVLERIEAGINEGDLKYASLWKLFVFVSDGLYQPNVLGRMQGEKDVDKHQACLEKAQRLIATSLRAAWNTWLEYLKEDAIKLNGDDATVVGVCVQEWRDKVRKLNLGNSDVAVPGPDVRHYLHGERIDTARGVGTSHCRDVRYKFSPAASGEDTPVVAWIRSTYGIALSVSDAEVVQRRLGDALSTGRVFTAMKKASVDAPKVIMPALCALWRGESDWEGKLPHAPE